MGTVGKVVLGLVLAGGLGIGLYFAFRKKVDEGGDGAADKDEGGTPVKNEPAESSGIQYVFQGGTGGNVNPADQVGIKLKEGVNSIGDIVKIDHPNYKGQFDVLDVSDAGDGTSIIFVKAPFVSAGTVQEDGVAIDRKAGTVALVGVPAEEPVVSADGKRKARFIGKFEAKARKAYLKSGKMKGLRGVALRAFIRKGSKPSAPVKPKTFVKK